MTFSLPGQPTVAHFESWQSAVHHARRPNHHNHSPPIVPAPAPHFRPTTTRDLMFHQRANQGGCCIRHHTRGAGVVKASRSLQKRAHGCNSVASLNARCLAFASPELTGTPNHAPASTRPARYARLLFASFNVFNPAHSCKLGR